MGPMGPSVAGAAGRTDRNATSRSGRTHTGMSARPPTGGGPGTNQYEIKGRARAKPASDRVHAFGGSMGGVLDDGSPEPDDDEALARPEPPLARYRAVAAYHQTVPVGPHGEGGHRPGGSCWHCGQAIANIIVARHTETDEEVTVGTTCAERLGLNADELREVLAERFANERFERSAAATAERRAQLEAYEAEMVAAGKPHGSEARFTEGCRCQQCVDVAPHGTSVRFFEHDCRCQACRDEILATRETLSAPVLIDAATGQVIEDARLINTKFGWSWRVDSRDVWVAYGPKRRSTMAKKGFLEGRARFMAVRGPDGDRHKVVGRGFRLSDPVEDRWGEPIATGDPHET